MNEVGRVVLGVIALIYVTISAFINFNGWSKSHEKFEWVIGMFFTFGSVAGIIYITNTL